MFSIFFLPIITIPICYLLFRPNKDKRQGYSLYLESKKESNSDKKLEILENAFKLYPTFELKCLLSQAYWEAAHFEKALPHFKEIINSPRCRNKADIGSIIGHCLLRTNQYEEALQYFELLDEAHEYGDFMVILPLKVECYVALKEFDKALECIQRGLAKRGHNQVEAKRKLKVSKAIVYSAMKDYKKARRELDNLLKEAPNYELAIKILNEIEKKEKNNAA
jgi:tetratricopeptide (TPR) repeat protein